MNLSAIAAVVIALEFIPFVVSRGQQAPLQITPWVAMAMFLSGAGAIAVLRFQAQLWMLRKLARVKDVTLPRSLTKP